MCVFRLFGCSFVCLCTGGWPVVGGRACVFFVSDFPNQFFAYFQPSLNIFEFEHLTAIILKNMVEQPLLDNFSTI